MVRRFRPFRTRRTWSKSWRYQLFFVAFLLGGTAALGQEGAGYGGLPLHSIRELLEGQPAGTHVLLRGAVTYNGKELVVQDQTGAIAVSSPSPVSVALGDQVEVQGDLVKRPAIPLVRNAKVRILWAGSTPLPLAITPDEAAEGAYNGMLVAIEGRLIKTIAAGNGALRLTLESGNQLFTCITETGMSPVSFSFTPGSVLRCTGVLSFNQPDRAFESGTFLVLLRTGTDIHLLTPAPWWTPSHLLLLFLLLLPLAALGYRMHLRNVEARLTLILEERSRIAREIHDTLAQGFAGIALQLQGVSRSMGQQSAVTNAHLAMALQMVRRSRAEAHRSIAALRTLHNHEDLAVMLGKVVRQLAEPAMLTLTVTQQGLPYRLSDEVASQILRISQEAIANTVEHAAARAVDVAISYAADLVTVEIRDDGRGFDLSTVGSVENGRFGITGMRERAHQIGALLVIRSGFNGTSLKLEIPAPSKVSRATQFFARGRRRALARAQHKGMVS